MGIGFTSFEYDFAFTLSIGHKTSSKNSRTFYLDSPILTWSWQQAEGLFAGLAVGFSLFRQLVTPGFGAGTSSTQLGGKKHICGPRLPAESQ